MTKELFRKLFILRDDVYAIQLATGSYFPIEEKITDDVIEGHLDGTHTIGLYQLDKTKIKWACLDIDVVKKIWDDPKFKLEDWESRLKEQADIAKVILDENGIPSYIEHSGNKGYHVWIFFESAVEAAPIKKRMHDVFDNMHRVDEHIEWEIFPKQTSVHSGYGNLVKGACGFHKKSNQFSKFVDEKPSLQTIKYAKPSSFYDPEPYKAVRYQCRALNNSWEEAIQTGEANNDLRFTLASMFVQMGPEAEQYLIDEFLSKLNNYDEKISRNRLDQIRNKDNGEGDKGYIPSRCDTMQDKGICSKTCDAIGRNVSPIAFHERALRDSGRSTAHINSQFRYQESPADSFDPKLVMNSLDNYIKHDKAYYKQVQVGKNTNWIKLTTFIMDVEKVLKIDDGQSTYTIYEGFLRSENGENVEFTMNSDVYSDPAKFRAFVYKFLSPNSLLIDSIEDVRKAIQCTINAEVIEVLKQFGYRYDENEMPTKYITPSTVITKTEIKKNEECIIDLSGESAASYLDLKPISDEEYYKVVEHIKEDLLEISSPLVMHSMFAYTLLPVLFPYLTTNTNKARFGLFIRGTTGSGKSYFAQHFQQFYGTFEHFTSWKSTPNALGRIGYFFKDAVYLVDDFKKSNIKNFEMNAVLGLIQNYADNTSRDRMKQTLELAKTYSIQGFLLCTGEDTPEGEASALARMIFLTLPKSERSIKSKRCEKFAPLYSGVTARFIKYCFQRNPLEFKKIYEDLFDEFYELLKGRANDTRIARNYAILCTAHQVVSKFIYDDIKKEKEITQWFVAEQKTRALAAILEATDELASTRFIQTLNELISTGKAKIQESSSSNAGTDYGSETIGYWAEVREANISRSIPHIIMGRAFELVQGNLRASSKQLQHSKKAIISELHEKGFIIDEAEKSRKMNNASVRVIRFKPETLLALEDDNSSNS